jgi:hypothetical protein
VQIGVAVRLMSLCLLLAGRPRRSGQRLELLLQLVQLDPQAGGGEGLRESNLLTHLPPPFARRMAFEEKIVSS